MLGLEPVWRYREFIRTSIVREYKGRFSRSRLGTLWMVLHPLAMAAIYAAILSSVLKAKIGGQGSGPYDYAIYLLAGLLIWTIFSEGVMRGLRLFLDNASMIKAMTFPRRCLPIIGMGVILINGIILLAATLLICAIVGHPFSPALALIPGWMVVTAMLAMALGMILGILNVFFRDIGEVVPVILQILFWLTPIVYPLSILDPALQNVIALNPLTPITSAMQSALLLGEAKGLGYFIATLCLALFLCLCAALLYRRVRQTLEDLL